MVTRNVFAYDVLVFTFQILHAFSYYDICYIWYKELLGKRTLKARVIARLFAVCLRFLRFSRIEILCEMQGVFLELRFRIFVLSCSLLDKSVIVDGVHQISGARERWALILPYSSPLSAPFHPLLAFSPVCIPCSLRQRYPAWTMSFLGVLALDFCF